jgi:hypothetical protein
LVTSSNFGAAPLNEAFYWNLSESRAKDKARVSGLGIVAADFPGPLLIKAILTYNLNVGQPWANFFSNNPTAEVNARMLRIKVGL